MEPVSDPGETLYSKDLGRKWYVAQWITHCPELLFSTLAGEDLRLVIAGKPVVAAEAERLTQLAAADPRVMLHLREIPDAEVTGLHRAADAGVLAYRDVFSSAALLLALSHGLPVVVPDEGTAREMAVGDAAERFAPGGLAASLDRMRERDPGLFA